MSKLTARLPRLAELSVAMIEQPLPVGMDMALRDIDRIVPICADESCHVSADLDRLSGLYDMVNVKLDETGGLTETVQLVRRARDMGFSIMVGCMEGTSPVMAPALLIAQEADIVDLDGPLLIDMPPDAQLWA